MEHITQHIKARRSVRTFQEQLLTEEDKALLSAFMESVDNPWHIPVAFKMLDAREHGLTCPVVIGASLYVGGKVKCVPNAFAAFGYAFEALALKAQSLGIGSVCLGGTMNRAAFEKAMELSGDEVMPCASPLGYPAGKMSLRESVMRKGVKADERLPFETLFFDRAFDTPLAKEAAGIWAEPLEMVRLAPSAVNKQPWRAVVTEHAVHFYLKRSKGLGHGGKLDMQMVDMGIALCHFALTAQALGIPVQFVMDESAPAAHPDMEYIAAYRLP